MRSSRRIGPARRRRHPRWRRWLSFLAGAAALLLAPALAHGQAGPDSVTLAWTAPGDDGTIGTASAYDLRMSLSPIDAGNFGAATAITGLAVPRASGTRETFKVRGLTRGTVYYFAIRTQDDAGNWSGLSNLLRWDWVLDTSPPAAPGGVTATRETSNARVRWSANSEPDLASYTVYRATGASGPFGAIASGIVVTDYLDAAVPGGVTTLWYALTASDDSGNESARSSAASVSFAGAAGTGDAWAIETGYPNPSRLGSSVTIPLYVPSAGAGDAAVDILDDGGRRVRHLSLGGLGSGPQSVTWDGKNDAGREVAPGVYRARLVAGDTHQTVGLVRVP